MALPRAVFVSVQREYERIEIIQKLSNLLNDDVPGNM